MASWDYNTGGYDENLNCPEGDITSSVDVYQWKENDSNRVIFLTRQDWQGIPGQNVNRCSWNHWENGRTDTVQHRWDENDIGDANQSDHEPEGGRSGKASYGVSISEGGAELSWTYTQPDVIRRDNSTNQRADWYWDYQSESAQDNTSVWEAGSECEFTNCASASSGDQILSTYGDHWFWDTATVRTRNHDITQWFYFS